MPYLSKNIFAVIMVILSLTLVGCGSTQKKSDSSSDRDSQEKDSTIDNQGLTLELNGDSDSGTAGALQTVFFAFDSAALTDEAKRNLENNSEYLQDNDDIEIQIEGHADERGGVQYNLALGEKRAESVKDYLVALGVSSSRISTLSFGKERPLAFGHNEEAWSQNRRANFVVTDK